MIYLIVFLTSAATLAFELAGARMLAPYLGTSVEVWAGVIGTILGGLSLGYWLGGKMADRYPERKHLAAIIFLSGASVALAWALRDIIPALFIHLPLGSLTFTTFAIGIILFVPASALFGAMSPYAAKLSLESLDATARTVGKLSAVGAVGSIVGTIATSSWIMPHVGTSMLLAGLALVLMALSVLLIPFRTAVGRVIGGVFLLFVAYGMNVMMAQSMDLIADVDTAYGRAWVRESKDAESGITVRSIHIDPYATQCASFITTDGIVGGELVFEYTKAFDIALAARPDAERLLVIGGCNYSYPRHALSTLPGAHLDAVEIDPGMTAIAEQYFDLIDDPRLTIIHEDARTYINRTDERYDVVFTDAFNSSASIPYHLATREAVGRIVDLLDDDSILVANLIGAVKGPSAAFVQAEIATIKSVFPAIRIFQIGSAPHDEIGNLIVIASKDASVVGSTAVDMFVSSRMDIKLAEVPLDVFDDGIILTDDYAPVESLTRTIRESYLEAARQWR